MVPINVEYDRPPLGYDLPRAIVITVDNFPVAEVVSQVPFSETLSLPIVQPLLPSHHHHTVKELRALSSESRVSNDGEKGNFDFNELNQQGCGSVESVLSLEYASTHVSSLKDEDCDAKRVPAVPFDVDFDDDDDDGLRDKFDGDFNNNANLTFPPNHMPPPLLSKVKQSSLIAISRGKKSIG
ncbi:unnamed protein product [Vicia faba]|uniref:Uncharacterized protein n=1 Tax=Vicia faba TaxID=3906 RepID=A0AAV0ZIF5_VICFA|nr:unnamed protein product [Vicia faba]